jgi:hypothetical protein
MGHWKLLASALGIAVALVAGAAIPASADTTRSPDRTQNVSAEQEFTPDPLKDSRPMLPSRDVAKVKAQQEAVQTVDTELGDYQTDGYAPRFVSTSRLPYMDELAPRADYLTHDGDVRMFSFSGKLWNHPVAQAQWGLMNVSSYLKTGDPLYLRRAAANAQRNVDRRVESRGAWWYSYDFDIGRCAEAPPMRAPWYSGMAQGQLLSLFVRLYEITKDTKWRTAADRTFDSLTLAPSASAPWGTWVDPNGYRWLEEYPQTGEVVGERVMNGHIFAIYGVYDYWRITRDARTLEVLDGAQTTVRRYLPNGIRLTNWASKYSLGCQHPHMGYHLVHTGQTLRLYEMTTASVFAGYASTLRSDYPETPVLGTVRFKAGTHVGYKFDINGKITGSKTMKLGRASNAPTQKRVRIKGRGIYYLITSGVLYGYLVAEQFPDRVLLGKTVEQRYYPARKLTFQPRTYTAYAYDKYGNVIASRVGTYSRTASVPLAATAVVNGRLSYLAADGYFKGWWMPHTSGISVS